MTEPSQAPQADEISLFELFEILWEGKWWLAGFVALALFSAGVFLLYKEPVYESRLFYTTQKLPYFINSGEAYTDFKQMLFNETTFNDWKKTNPEITMPFAYINLTEMLEGFIIAKEEHEQLVTLEMDKDRLKRERAFVLVQSARPDILPTANYLYLYMQHINTLLTARYLQTAKDALVIIEARFKDYSAINDSVVNNTLAIDRYIKSVEKGAKALTIDRPERPREAVSSAMALVLAVIAGGIIGIFYVFLRNAIRRYKAETGMAT